MFFFSLAKVIMTLANYIHTCNWLLGDLQNYARSDWHCCYCMLYLQCHAHMYIAAWVYYNGHWNICQSKLEEYACTEHVMIAEYFDSGQ